MNLTSRETATVLAALRYFQAEGTEAIKGMPQLEGEGLEPLTGRQIDRLCERINTDHQPKVLKKPLGKRWERLVNNQGYLTVTVPIDFDTLVDTDLEGLDDILDGLILGDNVSGSLSDISWKPVGTRGNAVLLEVTAKPEGIE